MLCFIFTTLTCQVYDFRWKCLSCPYWRDHFQMWFQFNGWNTWSMGATQHICCRTLAAKRGHYHQLEPLHCCTRVVTWLIFMFTRPVRCFLSVRGCVAVHQVKNYTELCKKKQAGLRSLKNIKTNTNANMVAEAMRHSRATVWVFSQFASCPMYLSRPLSLICSSYEAPADWAVLLSTQEASSVFSSWLSQARLKKEITVFNHYFNQSSCLHSLRNSSYFTCATCAGMQPGAYLQVCFLLLFYICNNCVCVPQRRSPTLNTTPERILCGHWRRTEVAAAAALLTCCIRHHLFMSLSRCCNPNSKRKWVYL